MSGKLMNERMKARLLTHADRCMKVVAKNMHGIWTRHVCPKCAVCGCMVKNMYVSEECLQMQRHVDVGFCCVPDPGRHEKPKATTGRCDFGAPPLAVPPMSEVMPRPRSWRNK